MRTTLTFVGALLCALCAVTLAETSSTVSVATPVEKPSIAPVVTSQTFDERMTVLEKKLKANPLELFSHGPFVEIGKRAEWVVYNLDSVQGWSLSGYSKASLTEDYKLRVLKIGFSPVIDEYTPHGTSQLEEEMWRDSRTEGGIPTTRSGFGIFFSVSF